MHSLNLIARPVGLFAAVLALLLMTGPAMAFHEESLVRVSGSTNLYWIDGDGVRHLVPTAGLRHRFFRSEPVTVISRADLLEMPMGVALGSAGPAAFRVSRVIETPVSSVTRIETRYGAPARTKVVRRTVVNRPVVVEKPVIVHTSETPVVQVDIDAIRGSRSREDELEDIEDWEDIRER